MMPMNDIRLDPHLSQAGYYRYPGRYKFICNLTSRQGVNLGNVSLPHQFKSKIPDKKCSPAPTKHLYICDQYVHIFIPGC
jgi:hypothetical protein